MNDSRRLEMNLSVLEVWLLTEGAVRRVQSVREKLDKQSDCL